MNVRCPYCRRNFNLSADYIAQALVEAAEKKQSHHGINCIHCRKLIKVEVRQMRRFAPAPAEADEADA